MQKSDEFAVANKKNGADFNSHGALVNKQFNKIDATCFFVWREQSATG